jgi:serine/threonine protein kinase
MNFFKILGLIFFYVSQLLALEKGADSLSHEYASSVFTHSKLNHIYQIAEDLQKKPWNVGLHEYHFKGVLGSFYKISTKQSILYSPPLEDEFMVDKGALKRVYKALFFTPISREVVAACVGPKKAILQEDAIFKIIGALEETPYRCSFPLSNDRYMLVLQYYNLGSLRKLRDANVHFDDKQKLSLAKCLVDALKTLHENNIAHRDIHDGNILIRKMRDGKMKAGLIDFGRSCSLKEKTITVPQGAPYRNPPEILFLSYAAVDKKRSDIYALGCSLYYIFFSKIYTAAFLLDIKTMKLLSSQEKERNFNRIQKEYKSQFKEFQDTVISKSKSLTSMDILKQTIFQMIQPNPEKRIDLTEVSLRINEALVKP